jgi:protein-disulfide isomerase
VSKERAREIAAKKLAEQRAAQRRRTAVLVTVVVVAVLGLAAAVGVGVYNTQHQSSGPVPVPTGGDATGVFVGKPAARVTVDLYVDFLCPHCREFEGATGPALDRFVAASTARIHYHPVAFLDGASAGTRYSTRSSAASACASDAGIFPPYARLLFANQPPEGSPGLTDDQLVALGKQAGATSAGFAGCVRSHRYEPWTAAVTEAASKANVTGTPTVLVAGAPVQNPTTAQVVAAIEAAAKRS